MYSNYSQANQLIYEMVIMSTSTQKNKRSTINTQYAKRSDVAEIGSSCSLAKRVFMSPIFENHSLVVPVAIKSAPLLILDSQIHM